MKKLIITALALASFSFMNAQEDGIRFGAKAGVNISNATGDDADNADPKIGFHVGAVVEIPISDVFAVQPELLFSTQGSKYEYEDFDGFDTYKVEGTSSLNYLNLPIMAKYYVAEGFSIQAGPQIGFLLSAENKEEALGEEDEQDVKEFLTSTDIGFNLGAGYQLESGIFFDARYTLGLTNIADDDDSDLKNTNIQVSVGYKF